MKKTDVKELEEIESMPIKNKKDLKTYISRRFDNMLIPVIRPVSNKSNAKTTKPIKKVASKTKK